MKALELKSGYIKVKPNKTNTTKPSNMEFKITKIKENSKEQDVIDDAIQLYIKTNFPGVTFKIITDPFELEKANAGFKI